MWFEVAGTIVEAEERGGGGDHGVRARSPRGGAHAVPAREPLDEQGRGALGCAARPPHAAPGFDPHRRIGAAALVDRQGPRDVERDANRDVRGGIRFGIGGSAQAFDGHHEPP